MAGRKTIMVDGGVWNKVEELKHNAYLRSSGDAIETAVDIASSDKYYAGIKAQINDSGLFMYVVESLGRTEDEAVRNLLKLEQGSIYGDLRSENVPPADETDIKECGFFVVECTKNLYHAGKLFDDPETWKEEALSVLDPRNLFTCTISKSKTGTLIADVQRTGGFNNFYVLVDCPENSNIARIVSYGTSPIELHAEFLVDYTKNIPNDYEDEYEALYSSYNAGNYEILQCTPRLFQECIGHIFQSAHFIQMERAGEIHEFTDKAVFPEYFGIIREEKNPETGEIKHIVDTTPAGHYYAHVVKTKSGKYGVVHVGDSANKASEYCRISHPVIIEDDRGKMTVKPGESQWDSIEENGERSGNSDEYESLIVECTVEVYARYLMSDQKNEAVLCTIEGEKGNRIARFEKIGKIEHKDESSVKTAPKSKTTSAKKTGGKK